MQIEILFYNSSSTEAQRSYAERCLRLALACFNEYIQWVAVRISDIYNPSGPDGSHCRVLVALAGLPDVVVEDIGDDRYIAIDRASNRAGERVSRRLAIKRNTTHWADLRD